MKITIFSDTHNMHNNITNHLIGGDILICAGDITSLGTKKEIFNFYYWFNEIKSYRYKIFIAGNHDFWLENKENKFPKNNTNTIYLMDESINLINNINIYGSPWQPEFYNWAFNIPRNSKEMEKIWENIPNNTDILITHGPPHGILDKTKENLNVGCEILYERINKVKPKIHIFGHIHEGYGYKKMKDTHYINGSILDCYGRVKNDPINLIWEKETNEVIFI